MTDVSVAVLGAESLGVRSMCTRVSTPDVSILLDPGCALGPVPGYPIPHPREYVVLHRVTRDIAMAARDCTHVFVSHYHHDHFTPRIHDETYIHASDDVFDQVYHEKTVFLKSTSAHVGKHQAARGRQLKQSLSKIAGTIEVVDSKRKQIGDTIMDFSHPLPHGEPGTRLGHVVCLRIRYRDECIVFAPDVQGPVSAAVLRFISAIPPSIAIVGGPPYHLQALLHRFPFAACEQAIRSLHEIAPLLVIDHHACRSSTGAARVTGFPVSVKEHEVMVAAQFAGIQPRYLEATRATLYEQEPPGDEFTAWAALDRNARNEQEPPVNGTGGKFPC